MRKLLAAALCLLCASSAYAGGPLTPPAPIASDTVAGKVKCDGVTTTCAADGTITATAGGNAGINQLTNDVTAGPAAGAAAAQVVAIGGQAISLGGTFTTNGNILSTGSGPTTLAFPNAARTFTFPSLTGTLIGTADTGSVTNGMLAGAIAASKLIGIDIATVGTITTGTWNAAVIPAQFGGTGINNGASTLTFSSSISFPAHPASTQCLHMAASGAVTTTGSDCGAGGGGMSTDFSNATAANPIATGGTGLAAVTAHNLPVGNGVNALALIAPSATSGIALISQGAALDPAYGTVVPAGGGTGLTSITAHNLPIGNGTSALTLLAPSATAGVPVVSAGAANDPVYGVASIPGGGTGASSIAAHGVVVSNTLGTALTTVLPSTNGNILTSNGTDWISGPPPSGITAGNPTASIGASATNGVATTFMRSDAAPAIGTNAVTNALLATMPTHTIKGNNTSGSASPLDLTLAQVAAELQLSLGGTFTTAAQVTTTGGGPTVLAFPAGATTMTFPTSSKTLMASDYSNGTTLTANAILTGGGAGTAPNAVAITGLVLGNGASAPTAYAGTSCTNQFPRSLSAAGAATCASVANADLTNSSLTLGTTSVALGATASTIAGVTSYNKVAITAPAGGATLTILDGKTLTVNNIITLAGTDSTVMTFPTSSKTLLANDLTNINAVLPPAFGGTGVNNSTFTLTLAQNTTLPTAAGTTQCVQMNSSGVMSLSGDVCGGAGGGGMNTDFSNATAANPVATGGTGDTTLTIHGVLVGNGTGAVNVTAAGTAGQVLTSNGASLDPTWQTLPGTGTVTSVTLTVPAASIFGTNGTNPITSSGSFGITTTGTLGGIPYFSSANTLASSGALTLNAIVLGGGNSAAPTSVASLGTTTTVLHGNAAGAPTFGAVANADLTNSTMTIAGHVIALGGTQTLAASDLTNGTSGSGAVTLASGSSMTAIAALGIRDTSAAFDVTIAATSSPALSIGKTLTLNMGGQAHTLAFSATANTITFPNHTDYTLIGNGDVGTVTNTMLAGSIASSKLVGTDIATVGTITTGIWTGTTIAVANGGTGATSLAGHGVVTMNSAGTAQTTVAPGATNNVLVSNGSDWISTAPSAFALTVTDGTHSVTGTTSLSTGAGLLVGGSAGSATLSLSNTINAQSGAGAYAIASGDGGKIILRTVGGADTIANATGSFGAGYSTLYVTGSQVGNTITPTTAKINNLTVLKMGAYQYASIDSDGTNYYAGLSVPQPATQTGTTVLRDDMTWTAFGTAGAAATGTSGHVLGFLDGNVTWSGATLKFTGLSAGTQVSCLGLDSGNNLVLNAAACGSGGGGGSVSITAATANMVMTPSPLTGTGTIGTTNAINTQSGNSAYSGFASSDAAKTIFRTNTVTQSDVLPQATGSFAAGYSLAYVTGKDVGNTLTATTSKINNVAGATGLALGKLQTVQAWSDGTDWWAAVGLPWPASQDGASYLANDMTWKTTPVGANPTATAGATAVNGSNATFMRSDGAPALPMGTSGHTIGWLDGNNVQSGTFSVTGAATFAEVHTTVVTEATTSRTVSVADCGKTILFTNAGANAYTTLNSITPGCSITVLQGVGAGQVTITAGAGATQTSPYSYTKTFGVGAYLGLFVDTGTGANAHYVISGEGA